ncbi:MAG: ATPase, T2SS/T4P/T4SS family [Promethearchaeota archaeon]
MSLKELSYFKEKENFDGKKEKILIIDCYNCPQKEEDFFKSKNCLNCFLNTLFKHKDRKFAYLSILWNDLLIESNKFNLILDYFKLLKTIKRIKSKIENNRNQKCKYKEFRCKILPDISSEINFKDYEYYNPILIYANYVKRLSNLHELIINDPICQTCYNNIEVSIEAILKILNNLQIIQKFKNYQANHEINKNYNNFYEFLFLGNLLLFNKNRNKQESNLKIKRKILNSYHIGKQEIYKVNIFENLYEIEKNYKVDFFYKGEPEEDYFENIIKDIYNNIEIADFDNFIPLENLIKIYKEEALKQLNSKYKFSKSVNKKIGFLTALKKLNLDKLFPFLIDDFIEEIFLDSPKDYLYINHQKFGRCRTQVGFNSKEIERIKALIRLYSGQRLDYRNPIIKFVIKNKYFYCRFSIDVEPIQINNFALDIRKLNKNILNIQDLLKNKTLDPLIAAFLYFIIIRRKNITVTGETDTGKTTLINALDLITPKEFRKIYVENVIESLNQFVYGKHQLKYKVDSLEDSITEKHSKSNQIKNLLHKTPDIIYLGEILTKEEAEAMFHCLAAGLRGFQTIHSKNIDSLINRFLYHFNINKSCLNDLGLIILMKKINSVRKIVGIFEICNHFDSISKFYNSIFEYDPKINNWVLNKSLYETNVIIDTRKYEDISKEDFFLYINLYKEIFEILLKITKINNIELIELFNNISFYSLDSITKLNQFWKNWKNSRSLNF